MWMDGLFSNMSWFCTRYIFLYILCYFVLAGESSLRCSFMTLSYIFIWDTTQPTHWLRIKGLRVQQSLLHWQVCPGCYSFADLLSYTRLLTDMWFGNEIALSFYICNGWLVFINETVTMVFPYKYVFLICIYLAVCLIAFMGLYCTSKM